VSSERLIKKLDRIQDVRKKGKGIRRGRKKGRKKDRKKEGERLDYRKLTLPTPRGGKPARSTTSTIASTVQTS
jgi:hypothetical protein